MSNRVKPFYTFTASGAGDTLQIFDEIGFEGVQATDFRNRLDAVKGSTLALEINSYGGDLFVGLTIFNMLKGSGKTINVKVMGVAASAASVIAMAGNTIEMPANTFMALHEAASGTTGRGTVDDHRAAIDLLDKINARAADIYVGKTGRPADEIKRMLKADTWLDADEAKAKGFASKVSGAIEARASFDMTVANLPERVKAIFTSSREAEIKALCAIAQRPQDSAGLIAAGKTVPEARAALAQRMAQEQAARDRPAPTGHSPAAIWNAHLNRFKGVK